MTVREHRCHTPPPAGDLTAASSFPETRPTQPTNTTPPF